MGTNIWPGKGLHDGRLKGRTVRPYNTKQGRSLKPGFKARHNMTLLTAGPFLSIKKIVGPF
jgi:hypothetical protein